MFDQIYNFKGKHADMAIRLTNPIGPNLSAKIFDTNLDLYAVAPLVGYLYNRKAPVDKSSDSNTKIFRDKMMDESENLKYNFRLLMLLCNKNLGAEERTRIAFKLDNCDAERKVFDELYDEYVRGGVEVIYEHIFEDADDVDGYLMNLYEFIDDLNNRYNVSISELCDNSID